MTERLQGEGRDFTGIPSVVEGISPYTHKAKRLMLNEDMDATSAAFHVGYETPSQFSRENSRLFGLPPKRDIEELRQGCYISFYADPKYLRTAEMLED